MAIKNIEMLQDFSSKIITIYVFLGMIAGISTALFTRLFFVRIFNIPFELRNDAVTALTILSLHIALSLPSRYWEGYVQASQAFAFYAFTSMVSNFVQATFTILALKTGHGIVSLSLISFFSFLISWALCLGFYLSRKRLYEIRLRLGKLALQEIRSLISLSFRFFILQACAMIIFQTDRLLIALFFPISTITTYEIGLRIHNTIRNIVTSIQIVVLPASSRLNALSRVDQLRQMVIRGTKYVFILSFLLAVPAGVLSKEIINSGSVPSVDSRMFPRPCSGSFS